MVAPAPPSTFRARPSRSAPRRGVSVRREAHRTHLERIERMVGIRRDTIERGLRDGSVDHGVDAESAARIIISDAPMSAQMKLADFEPDRAEWISWTITAMLLPLADRSAAFVGAPFL